MFHHLVDCEVSAKIARPNAATRVTVRRHFPECRWRRLPNKAPKLRKCRQVARIASAQSSFSNSLVDGITWSPERGLTGACNSCSRGIGDNRAKWAVHRCGTRHHRSLPELAPANDPGLAKGTRWRKSAAGKALAKHSRGGRIATDDGTTRMRSAVSATVEIRGRTNHSCQLGRRLLTKRC